MKVAFKSVRSRFSERFQCSIFHQSGHAFLACGTPNGSVFLVEIAQDLNVTSSDIFNAELTSKVSDIHPFDSDGRIMSTLSWINAKDDEDILVKCTAGLIELYSFPHSKHWHGNRTLRIPTIPASVGSSSLCSVSGLVYVSSRDTLLCSLSDGSIYSIHQFSTDPSINSGDLDRYSLLSRRVFEEVEHGQVHHSDLNAINGMMSFNGSSTMVWAHE